MEPPKQDASPTRKKPKPTASQHSSSKVLYTKQNFTHFLSIPFTTDEFKTNLENFKATIMNDSEMPRLPENLFQTPNKLHITLSMLVLPDEDHQKRAMETLEECKEKFIDPILQGEPLKLNVAGVAIFADADPAKARVVFAKIESEKLQKLAEEISEYFISKNLVQRERNDVKLHLTLMNTSFVNTKGSWRQKFMLDARKILEKFGDFHFGTLTVDRICISSLSGKDETGYYESIGVLKITE